MSVLHVTLCLSVLILVVSALPPHEEPPSGEEQLRELLNEFLREHESDHLQQRQLGADVHTESRGQTFLDKWLGVKPKNATPTEAATTEASVPTTPSPEPTPVPIEPDTYYNAATFQQICQTVKVLPPGESSGNAKRDLIVNLIYDVCQPGLTPADLDQIEAYLWVLEQAEQVLKESEPLTTETTGEETTPIPTTQSTSRTPTTPISTTQSTTSAPPTEAPTEPPSNDSHDTVAQRELKAMINREMLRELVQALRGKDD